MSLKGNLLELARDAGIDLGNARNATIAVNAINNEAYGAQNVLLGDRDRYRVVFKRCRTSGFHAALTGQINDLRELLSGPSYRDLGAQLVVGQEVTRNAARWLMFPFADGPSAYMDIRSHLRGERLTRHFERALRLARDLDGAASEHRSLAEVVRDSNVALERHDIAKRVPHTDSQAKLHIGLAHLDFAPDNLLLGQSDDWLIDFEYWDYAPVAWNLFDMMTSFGSLAGLSLVARRKPAHHLRIFDPPETATFTSLWDSVCSYIQDTSLAGLSQDAVVSLVHAWFAAKVTAQPRVYGKAYGFSTRWHELWDLASEGPIDALAKRWPR